MPPATDPAHASHRDEPVRPIASALLTAGAWALARPGRRRLGALLVGASLVMVARQRRRG